MGTLYNQPPRRHREVDDHAVAVSLSTATKLAKKHGVLPADVIAAAQILELRRRNYLYIDNGDAWDEQIGGIGQEMQRLSAAVEDFNDAVSTTREALDD